MKQGLRFLDVSVFSQIQPPYYPNLPKILLLQKVKKAVSFRRPTRSAPHDAEKADRRPEITSSYTNPHQAAGPNNSLFYGTSGALGLHLASAPAETYWEVKP